MWAIGGGKGGVGRSVLTLTLGFWLAKFRKKVIVVDADLGGANLNILLGIRYPSVTLWDFINKKVARINDVLIDTPYENLSLICGADDMLGLANPKYTQRKRFLNHLNTLSADFILFDLGSGTSFNVLDFFLYAEHKIVVLTPQATSVQNVYGFIKSSLLRHLQRDFSRDESVSALITRFSTGAGEEKISSIGELKDIVRRVSAEKYLKLCQAIDSFDIKTVVNMAKNAKDRQTSKIVSMVAKRYLDIEVTDFGFVKYDPEIEKSVNKMVPFLRDNNQSETAMSTYAIAHKMANGISVESSKNVNAKTDWLIAD